MVVRLGPLQPLDERQALRSRGGAHRREAQGGSRRILRIDPPHAQPSPPRRPRVAGAFHRRAAAGGRDGAGRDPGPGGPAPKGPRLRPRVWSVDVVGLWASLQMVNGHTIDAVLLPSIEQGPIFDTYNWARGLVSVCFLMVAGIAFHLSSLARYEQHRREPAAIRRRLRRAPGVIRRRRLPRFPWAGAFPAPAHGRPAGGHRPGQDPGGAPSRGLGTTGTIGAVVSGRPPVDPGGDPRTGSPVTRTRICGRLASTGRGAGAGRARSLADRDRQAR